MCGLKQGKAKPIPHAERVTPHVGVWIETFGIQQQQRKNQVTPHVGVWIETSELPCTN